MTDVIPTWQVRIQERYRKAVVRQFDQVHVARADLSQLLRRLALLEYERAHPEAAKRDGASAELDTKEVV